MSYQLTMAHGAREAAERDWKRHKGGCVGCSATGRGAAEQRCATGRELWEELAAARAQVVAEREADRQPIPGEVALWG